MSDWTEGYMAEIGYTYGYYAELNPVRIKLAFLNAGYAFPEVGTACELGFGQGVSANIHAAASVTRWYGTDFNPAQAGFAQELAQASGARAQLYDDPFDAFCTRGDLPDFDYIGLHGIWSWISDENRDIVADFIRRKLKVGGVLYISYNTQPGWAAMAPVRDLMAEHAELMGAPGQGIVPRIDAALAFVQKLVGPNSGFGAANPIAARRLEQIQKQDRQYLAHEYFNQHWVPFSFARMHRKLGELKLTYACSASLLEHVDAVNLNAEQQKVLEEVPDRNFRESVRDFLVNQAFRRDYWVRGARPLPALERSELLREQRLVLGVVRQNVALTVKGVLGEAQLQERIYVPLLDLMADFRVRTLGEIERALAEHGIRFNQLVQAVVILVAQGVLYPAQEEAVTAAAAPQAAALNRKLCRLSRATTSLVYLASPLTGGGVAVSRIEQMFLLAREAGQQEPAAWARHAMELLVQQGQGIVRDGQVVETPDGMLAELLDKAAMFRDTRLPLLQALRVAT